MARPFPRLRSHLRLPSPSSLGVHNPVYTRPLSVHLLHTEAVCVFLRGRPGQGSGGVSRPAVEAGTCLDRRRIGCVGEICGFNQGRGEMAGFTRWDGEV